MPLAIGAYNGANLARLADPRFDVLVYAFASARCSLRRYHPFYAPIAILKTIYKDQNPVASL
jgi:hypothetical protein